MESGAMAVTIRAGQRYAATGNCPSEKNATIETQFLATDAHLIAESKDVAMEEFVLATKNATTAI
jgi:hypothetical protein